MHKPANINRDDDGPSPISTNGFNSAGNGAANGSRKTLPERVVIALMPIVRCFAFDSDLLR
jgi:hypothetical protein